MPNWRELYKVAVLEPDDTKLATRLSEAEAAMFQRLVELAQGPEQGEEEYREIRQASRGINSLRMERLGVRYAAGGDGGVQQYWMYLDGRGLTN